jgi:hypothetical protein
VTGKRALDKGQDEIKQLGDTAQNSVPVANDLADFLRDIDDPNRAVAADRRANRDTGRTGETGYTGMEGLLNYVYYQPLAINQYDEIGHLLHFTIFEVGTGPCSSYNAGEYDPDGPGPAAPQKGVPNQDGSAATTNLLAANRCVAWLGDNQPGLNSGPSLPPYDPSVCPNGSNDPSLCNSAAAAQGDFAANSLDSRSKPADGSGDAEPTTPDDVGPPGDATDDGGAPDLVPDVPGAPTPDGGGSEAGLPGDLGDALDGVRGQRGGRSGGSGGSEATDQANQDLLGYLFGN